MCVCPNCGSDAPECPMCEGCGLVSNTSTKEPWIFWVGKVAAVLGLVLPKKCPECDGTGLSTMYYIRES